MISFKYYHKQNKNNKQNLKNNIFYSFFFVLNFFIDDSVIFLKPSPPIYE